MTNADRKLQYMHGGNAARGSRGWYGQRPTLPQDVGKTDVGKPGMQQARQVAASMVHSMCRRRNSFSGSCAASRVSWCF